MASDDQKAVLYEELVKIVDELLSEKWDDLDSAAQDFIADRIDDIELGRGFSKDDADALIEMARDHEIRK